MGGVILQKLERRMEAVNSLVCVGLDPQMDKLPERFRGAALPMFEFGKWVIEQTHEFVAAYKPNMAFYEARGVLGLEELDRTMAFLHEEHPEIVTICDAKRADIGSTNRGYVAAIFDAMGFDGVTLHPYLGREALMPFLEREDKASIVLCRTSNPGAGEFQDLLVDGRPLWQTVAERVSREWNAEGNCMLVVGATYPEEMRKIREVAPEMTFLVPGVGAQGGDVAEVVAAGLDAKGKGLLISSSRAILQADDPGAAARVLRDEIRIEQAAALSARSVHAAH